MARTEYDVAIISDFRFPGGTSSAIAEQVKAQASVGYTTALIHSPSSILSTARSFNKVLIQLVQSGVADLVPANRPLKARLLTLWHPSVFESPPPIRPQVKAEVKVLVANSPPFSRDRSESYYNVHSVRSTLDKLFGEGCIWAPIGPLVRQTLTESGWKLNLADEDWYEVINVDEWLADRSKFAGDRPVIGRHSRPEPEKWPASAAEILSAYPDDDRLIVKILGGANTPLAILKRIPANWRVYPFGAMPPARFLREIDFFVYFHHPAWVEAFGRTILEAIASGAVAILPAHFQALFQESAIYAPPEEVKEIVLRLYGDPAGYRMHSECGVKYVRDNFSYKTHIRRVEGLIGAPSGEQAAVRVHRPATKRNVLFITSNGAGLGHLSRMLAIARRMPADIQPVFLTMSQAIRVVRKEGFLAEYFPSWDYAVGPADPSDKKAAAWRKKEVEAWTARLERRATEAIALYNPVAVVVDANQIYDGLREALQKDKGRPFIWCRRAMWKGGRGGPILEHSRYFHVVIEPGELAGPVDVGVTYVQRAEVDKVSPILLLDESELLDKAEARKALGVQTEGIVVLVQLGAGNVNDVVTAANAFVRRLIRDPGLQIVVSESVIANKFMDFPDQVRKVSLYPLGKYYRAFDFVISASGYNSFHEMIGYAIPSIIVPSKIETALEDQTTRAAYAQEIGAALCVEEIDDEQVDRAVKFMLDRSNREAISARCRRVAWGDGAREAADILIKVIEAWPRPWRPKPAPATPAAGPAPAVPPPAPATNRERLIQMKRAGEQQLKTLAARSKTLWKKGRGFLGWRARRLKRALVEIARGPQAVAKMKAVEAKAASPVLLLIAWGFSEEELEQLVEHVRLYDLMMRNFNPVFVIDSQSFQPFRRYRYQFEYVPPEREWNRHDFDLTWADYRDERLRSIVQTYKPSSIIALDDKNSFDSLRRGMLNPFLMSGE